MRIPLDKVSLKLSVSSLQFNECFLNDSREVIGGWEWAALGKVADPPYAER